MYFMYYKRRVLSVFVFLKMTKKKKKKEWLQFCGINHVDFQNAWLCSAHFDLNVLTRRSNGVWRISKEAVPTILPAYDNNRFPKDPECRKLCCEFCRLDSSDSTKQNVRLCSLHFSPDSLINREPISARCDLKKGSIPSINPKIDAINANSLRNVNVKQEVMEIPDNEDLANLPPVDIQEYIGSIFIVEPCNSVTSVNVQNCLINRFDIQSSDDSESISDQNNAIDVSESPSKENHVVDTFNFSPNDLASTSNQNGISILESPNIGSLKLLP